MGSPTWHRMVAALAAAPPLAPPAVGAVAAAVGVAVVLGGAEQVPTGLGPGVFGAATAATDCPWREQGGKGRDNTQVCRNRKKNSTGKGCTPNKTAPAAHIHDKPYAFPVIPTNLYILSHPLPPPNPIVYLGISCTTMKLVE